MRYWASRVAWPSPAARRRTHSDPGSRYGRRGSAEAPDAPPQRCRGTSGRPVCGRPGHRQRISHALRLRLTLCRSGQGPSTPVDPVSLRQGRIVIIPSSPERLQSHRLSAPDLGSECGAHPLAAAAAACCSSTPIAHAMPPSHALLTASSRATEMFAPRSANALGLEQLLAPYDSVKVKRITATRARALHANGLRVALSDGSDARCRKLLFSNQVVDDVARGRGPRASLWTKCVFIARPATAGIPQTAGLSCTGAPIRQVWHWSCSSGRATWSSALTEIALAARGSRTFAAAPHRSVHRSRGPRQSRQVERD